MAKFLCTHTVPPKAVTLDMVKQISRAAQTDAVVKGERSFGNLSEGRISCIFEGPNREAVAGFFKSKNMPVDSIVQMDFEGECGEIVAL
ncbi:MAG TPA: nickel-binding protein [Phycisphaerae bacterium]|nr:nickel-binding protein [Phycisphaerae bacterium]